MAPSVWRAVYEPLTVISCTFPFILSIIICSIFTIDEIKKRFKDRVQFKSTSLKWLSLLSITAGLARALLGAIFFVNGLCYFSGRLSALIRYLQPIFVGLYALNRLHLLFAGKKVPNGYPRALFVGMILIAVLYVMGATALIFSRSMMKECGWRGDLQFHFEYWYFIDGHQFGIWYGVNMAIYLLWESFILLLFIIKMRSLSRGLTSSAALMVVGIQKEMRRIIILTILYLVFCFVEAIWFVADYEFNGIDESIRTSFSRNEWFFFYEFVECIRPTLMSYAVYLMQRHNAEQYAVFLKRVVFCKLHFCCCCYWKAVQEQLEFFKPDGGSSELKEKLLNRQDSETELITAYGQFSLDVPPESRSVP